MSPEAEVSQGLIDGVNHLFDEYGPWGTLEYVIEAWADVREANRRAALSPPAPIRRRFTMNTIENVTIAKMGGADVVGSSGGHPSSSLALCVSWLCFDDERWVDVEMKSGHHLTTYGEATDE